MLDRDYLVEQAKEFEKVAHSKEGFIAYDTYWKTPVVRVTPEAIQQMFGADEINIIPDWGSKKYIANYEGVKFIATEILW